MAQTILFSENLNKELGGKGCCIDVSAYDALFVLVDENTDRCCRPALQTCEALQHARPIVIAPSDTHKNVEALSHVWQALSEGGASRRSLLLCLGGGMVTDLGGFAAATFKRGIDFVNIPTTLLAMVDAAVGGKTGINFNGLKNEVGAFREAVAVVVDTKLLQTLDAENMRSGYAEMLKHALLADSEMWARHLLFDIDEPDFTDLQKMVGESIEVKRRIVEEDPYEHGLRKALNLGHTVGHAFESLAMEKENPVLHGYAVAWGLAAELFLSHVVCQFPIDKMRQTVAYVRQHYGAPLFSCKDYERLYALMLHDKKNVAGQINFTLLEDVGKIRLDCRVEKELLFEMFDFVREGM